MLRRSLALPTIAFAPASTDALAAAQRTFVASTGNDTNPCSLLQPCHGFAAAVAPGINMRRCDDAPDIGANGLIRIVCLRRENGPISSAMRAKQLPDLVPCPDS